MMSLVGCSGEDFLGILRSLDFRMQKKTVKRPLAAPAVAAVAPPLLMPEPRRLPKHRWPSKCRLNLCRIAERRRGNSRVRPEATAEAPPRLSRPPKRLQIRHRSRDGR